MSLSGGLDSSAIAVCAVELLGAKNVCAFTHEFQDPEHPSEARDAQEFARHLGIRHRTVKITYQDCRDSVLETAWRLESPKCVRPTQHLVTAKRVKEEGFAKLLTGAQMEQLLGIGYSESLDRAARIVPWIPLPGRTLRFWRRALSSQERWPGLTTTTRLAEWIPALKPPPHDRYYLLLCVLQYNGLIPDAAVFYPPSLRERVRAAVRSPNVADTIGEVRGLPLRVQLRYIDHCYRALPLVSRFRLSPQAAGISRVSPAQFPTSRHSSYFWRHPRLGRPLLKEAMKDRFTQAVLQRPKVPELGPLPQSWLTEILRSLAPLTAPSRGELTRNYFPDYESLRGYFDGGQWEHWLGWKAFGEENINKLALWHKIHIDLPMRTSQPRWEDLSE